MRTNTRRPSTGLNARRVSRQPQVFIPPTFTIIFSSAVLAVLGLFILSLLSQTVYTSIDRQLVQNEQAWNEHPAALDAFQGVQR